MSEDILKIYDAMNVLGAEVQGDQYFIGLIATTLHQIPEETREKVLSEVLFIVCGGISGEYFPLYVNNRSIVHCILLNFCEMRKLSESETMTVIAHEIAHYILGHRIRGGKSREIEADDLCEKWGFGRAYQKD